MVINQVRIDMGKTYGNPEQMPGGKGLRFASSLTVLIKKGAWLTDESENISEDDLDTDFVAVDTRRDAKYVGFKLWMRTEKNKQGIPFQDTEVKFFFNGTVDPTSALIDMALRKGVIQESGKGYFIVPGVDRKLHGVGAIERKLKKEPKLMKALVKEVRRV